MVKFSLLKLTSTVQCYRSVICSYRESVELPSESGADLMTQLDELWFWAKLKDEELTSHSTTGDDTNNLLEHQDCCMVSYRRSP